MAARAPIDHILAAIDEAFFVEADEDFTDGAGKAGVESEALAAPIATGAQTDHLAFDSVAVLLFPCPDALFKFFAAQVEAVDAFLGEFALHHHLSGDAGVVRAGQPERIFAQHAMPADRDVDLSVFQHVADVEKRPTGNVRRRND